jgi:kynurenine formamidase
VASREAERDREADKRGGDRREPEMAKMIESHEIIARSLELTPTAPWPAGDERGMANAIGPGTWLRAAQHLAAPRAKCYELSHPISNTMPSSPFGKPLKFQARATRGIKNSRHASNMEEMLSGEPGAQGTHMDALGHFGALAAAWNGTEPFPADSVKYYGGHDQSAVKPDPLGTLAKLGIDKAAPIITTAVLLDAQRFIAIGKPLEPGYAVTAKDIDTMLARQGLSERGILPGDVLYIHTGWGVRWKDPDVDKIYYTQGPGLSYDGAHLAQEKGVALVALDNPFTDAVRAGMLRGEAPIADDYPADLPFAVHHHLLTQAGIHQIQNAKLDELASDGVWLSCTFILPLRFQGGGGSPVRAIAIGVPQLESGPSA